jgi:hypothetical protein
MRAPEQRYSVDGNIHVYRDGASPARHGERTRRMLHWVLVADTYADAAEPVQIDA